MIIIIISLKLFKSAVSKPAVYENDYLPSFAKQNDCIAKIKSKHKMAKIIEVYWTCLA